MLMSLYRIAIHQTRSKGITPDMKKPGPNPGFSHM